MSKKKITDIEWALTQGKISAEDGLIGSFFYNTEGVKRLVIYQRKPTWCGRGKPQYALVSVDDAEFDAGWFVQNWSSEAELRKYLRENNYSQVAPPKKTK